MKKVMRHSQSSTTSQYHPIDTTVPPMYNRAMTTDDSDAALAKALAAMDSRMAQAYIDYIDDDLPPHPPPDDYIPPRPSQPSRLKQRIRITVSDPAWHNLMQNAVHCRYIRSGSKTAKGLARYIRATFIHPLQQWIDMRPQWMRDDSLKRLDPANDATRRLPHTLPKWWDPDATLQRKQRMFALDDIPLAEIRTLAVRLGITDPRAHEYRFSDGSIVSAVLEAWGQRHLLPEHEPSNPNPVDDHWRRRAKEIVW